jgi:hypothetical protein
MWLVLIAALLHPNSTPRPGEVGAFYFDVLNESQVWVDLEPTVLEDGPNPIRVNFTAAFKGRSIGDAPPRIRVRAKSDGSMFPLRIRVPVLQFQLHDDSVIDLTGTGSVYNFFPGCEKCAADTLTTDMPFAQFQTLAASPYVQVEALGFKLRLSPKDLTALRKLSAAVSDGATVADH